MTATSTLSSKGQVTIPKEIRDQLGAQAGDTIVYEVDGNTVILKKAEPFDIAFHSAVGKTLDEWNSPEDEEAFRDL